MSTVDVPIPDIGEFDNVDVIEVLVAVGDTVAVEQSLITLESDKATMEIPSPVAGVVRELLVEVGSQVGEGAVIARVEAAAGAAAPAPEVESEAAPAAPNAPPASAPPAETPAAPAPASPRAASPAARSPAIQRPRKAAASGTPPRAR